MDAKTSEWRAGPNVCRCCLTEGCYKDISTEYFWMGKREVYAEMLADTLNVSISYSQSGGPNSNSRLICELCISRLRDASDFKRQVLECEKSFTQHLDAGASNILELDVTVEPADSDVKLEHVKQEKRLSDDDDDFDDRCGFDDDDDDDLDDQPLTKLATKIPKKETVDILDLLDNSKATEKRKSSTKTKAVPAKKTKSVKKEPVKAGASKVVAKTDKKKKDYDPLAEARQNAKQILKYSTAYPFRIPVNQMMCVCCRDCFEDPEIFRQHMRQEHRSISFARTLGLNEYLKADCTDLGCKICAKKFTDLKSVAEHLFLVHDKKINLNFDLGIQVFVLGDEKWVCANCHKKFPCLRSLSRHNGVHYHKYACEICGRTYTSSESLRSHRRISHSQYKICVKCKQSFTNKEELQQHKLTSSRCWPYVCSVCNERFRSVKLKTEHLSETHGVKAKKEHKCPLCPKSYTDNKSYRAHYISAHTDVEYTCEYCSLKFHNASNLSSHKIVHTKEKIHQCPGCPKAFLRIKNLKQHMWVHSEKKRFSCEPCHKQFNQRVSWKSHMRSYHPELVDFE
nr:zinc finger protein 652-A isoform X15 [Helicoverpa armigera]